MKKSPQKELGKELNYIFLQLQANNNQVRYNGLVVKYPILGPEMQAIFKLSLPNWYSISSYVYIDRVLKKL